MTDESFHPSPASEQRVATRWPFVSWPIVIAQDRWSARQCQGLVCPRLFPLKKKFYFRFVLNLRTAARREAFI